MAQETIEIDFNPDLFNNIYWHLKDAVENDSIRYIFAYGGSSASKTFSLVQLTVVKMLEDPEYNTLVMRKFATDIRDSIYADFKGVINDWGLAELFTIQQNFIKCNVTGAFVRFRGLDNSEKVKGISKFKKVVLEEVSQFDEADYKQIKKRLRGMSGQQIIGLFNPISEEHWIKKNVFDTEDLQPIDTDITGKWINKKGNFLVLKVTYMDNKYIVGPHFIDQHVIDDFEKDKETDYAYYSIYALGNWGKIRTGGEFWKDFNANRHVKSNVLVNGRFAMFDPEKAIHMTWDENVNPYLTCLLWQIHIKDGKKVAKQFDEICLEDPRNRVKHICAEFIKRYPSPIVNGLLIYGDRSSIKEDTKKEKGENFYTEVGSHLKDYKPSLRMQSVNPPIVTSGNFINEIYAREYEGISIEIGENCKKSIFDYSYAMEDSDGTLKKSKKKNPVTEVTYEEFGHCSDAKRYFMTVAFASEFDKYKKGGKTINITAIKRTTNKSY